MGAHVTSYALDPLTNPSLFELARLDAALSGKTKAVMVARPYLGQPL
jgi:hypothetical protein